MGGGLAGLILAGGEGKRWGAPKAWATVPDGRSFLESCTEILRLAGARPIVTTLPPGTHDPEIDGLTAVALPAPGLDMFASTVIGLSHLAEHPGWSSVAILPVDHPLVKPETITVLMDARAEAAIPSFRGKHGHPVRLDRETVEKIVCGALPGPTLREVLRAVNAVEVPVGDRGIVSNCNTPEALEAALENFR